METNAQTAAAGLSKKLTRRLSVEGSAERFGQKGVHKYGRKRMSLLWWRLSQ
jgi:hypothetical protein